MDLGFGDLENNQTRCGEIYFATSGQLTFFCTLCEKQFDGFDLYEVHIKDHVSEFFNDEAEVKNEECMELLEVIVEEKSQTKSRELDKTQELNMISSIKIENDDVLKETEISIYEINSLRTYNKQSASRISKKPKKNVSREKPIVATKPLDTADKEMVVPEVVREVKTRIHPKSLLTPETERIHKCPICRAGFKERSNMKHHFKRHTGEKDKKCPECGKAFFTTSEVRIHMRSHKGERAFLCNICGNAYVSNSHLLAHLRRHTNQKNHECKICKKAFYDPAQLSDHMASHSTERPFACEVCSATFPRKKALQNHLKLHENKRAYKCEICNSGFNQRAGLFSHMKTTHKTA